MATKYSAHNAGGGGIGSIGDPYTLQELVDNIDGSTNALGLVMNTGTYALSGTAKIDFDTNAGTELLPVIIRGANADGSDDGTIATISGSAMDASQDIFYILKENHTIYLENLRLTASKRFGIHNPNVSSGQLFLHNCQVDNSISHGIYNADSAAYIKLFECEINNNVRGLSGSSAARGGFRCYRCSIHDNSSDGVYDGISGSIWRDTLFYDNGGNGLFLPSGQISTVLGCVFFGNTGDGIDTVTGARQIIENCIGRSNGGYFINTNTGTIKQFLSCKNNCSHNNTSGHIDINSNVLPGTGHIYQDPLFVSETDGSEDFSLQSGSPCLAAAIDAGVWTVGGGTSYRDIGAVQRQAGAGAGGLLMANKRGNKQ